MHMHHHGDHSVELDPRTRRKARIILSALIIPLLVATVVGMIILFPNYSQLYGSRPVMVEGASEAHGRVVSTSVESCLLADGKIGGQLLESAVCAKITEGKGKGITAPIHLPPENMDTVKVGTELKLIYDPSLLNSGTPYVFWDIERAFPVGLLAVLYVLLVLGVAGLRGLAALVGLAMSSIVLILFVVPALMAGESPLIVTLVGTSAMMFLSVYMAHGITIRTTTALIGTFGGLALTTALAMAGVTKAGLTGASSEDALSLMTYFPNLSLSAMLTCGIVIAGLGALNDVTITQASAVWELHEANPHMTRWRLFSRAMRIGRDHIASTVYTLAFAYAGTALPTLFLASMVDRSVVDLALSSSIAEEIVRTLVASIGLVLAIPATTIVGVILVKWIQSDSQLLEDDSVSDNSHQAAVAESVLSQVDDGAIGEDAALGEDGVSGEDAALGEDGVSGEDAALGEDGVSGEGTALGESTALGEDGVRGFESRDASTGFTPRSQRRHTPLSDKQRHRDDERH